MYDIIIGNFSFYFLCLMVITALFLNILGIRRLMKKEIDGFLYILVSGFLFFAHVFYMVMIPSDNELSYLMIHMNIWYWTVLVLAPSLIVLFLVFGFLDFMINRNNLGTFNIFFGLTLLCFIFMLGMDWSIVLKALITFGFAVLFFNTEIRITK